MGPLRFGVLGAAKITPGALLAPAADVDGVVVTAVAARDPGRAKAFAEEHGIPRVEADYAALVTSEHVDAVYNPLPMSLHCEWTIAALRAGKAVLCEKPFASNAAEAEEMVRVADEAVLPLVEAFHWRFHPLAERVLEILRAGTLGPLEHASAEFTVPRIQSDDIRMQYALAGGSLMDLGCYPVHWLRTFFGSEPEVVSARAIEGPPKIDIDMRATLRFPGGATAEMHCAMMPDARLGANLAIRGRDGELTVTNPLAPHIGHALRVQTGKERRNETVRGKTTYHHQLEAFVARVRDGVATPTEGTEPILNMKTIDAIYRASGLGERGH